MRIRTTIAAAGAILALAAAPALAVAAPAPVEQRAAAAHWMSRAHPGHSASLAAVGLTRDGTALVGFSTTRPGKLGWFGTVRGLQGDSALVGIDYRVQDGLLYGVGNAGGVYGLSTPNATAIRVGQLSVALTGTWFGVDFNPAANALRIISDTGQNLRQPFPTSGSTLVAPTAADTALTLPVPAGGTPPAPTATGLTAAAYTNNDLDPATGTTLFDLNTALDQITIQSPANAGTTVATGALGVDAASDAGFDIYSTVRLGRTVDLRGFATLTVGGSSALYTVDLLTGTADRVGRFAHPITDLAIPLQQR